MFYGTERDAILGGAKYWKPDFVSTYYSFFPPFFSILFENMWIN